MVEENEAPESIADTENLGNPERSDYLKLNSDSETPQRTYRNCQITQCIWTFENEAFKWIDSSWMIDQLIMMNSFFFVATKGN